MTTTTVQTVVAAAQHLTPTEQFELIQTLTRLLQQRYIQVGVPSIGNAPTTSLPANVRRTAPVKNLTDFAADFWPQDETADDIIDYIAQQRAADRAQDLPSNEEIL